MAKKRARKIKRAPTVEAFMGYLADVHEWSSIELEYLAARMTGDAGHALPKSMDADRLTIAIRELGALASPTLQLYQRQHLDQLRNALRADLHALSETAGAATGAA